MRESSDVTVHHRDEVHVVVRARPDILYHLQDLFTFEVPGHQHMPAFRAGLWDGKIRLFNPLTPVLYKGLVAALFKECREQGWSIDMDREVAPAGASRFSTEDARREVAEWAVSVTKEKYEARDYQLSAFTEALRRERAVFLSSTSSGKTMMIYRVCRFYAEDTGKPALIITKRTNLVVQMIKDFQSYSTDTLKIQGIKGGADKRVTSDYVVSTWQSARLQPREWFNQFSVVCVDEAHSADSKEMSKIMEKCTEVKYRFGFTGTLKNSKVSEMTLTGLFGPPVRVSTTRERMIAGDVSKLKIRVVQVDWPDEDRKKLLKMGLTKSGNLKPASYQQEIDVVIKDARRVKKIAEYVSKLRGNVLVLFNRNEDFGLPLYDAIVEACPDRQTRLVYGDTDDDSREEVRTLMESSDDVVAQASLGTFAEGTSIDNIKHLVLAYPVKSEVRLLQSIGRGLRKHHDKDYCEFHDFADDMRTKRHVNYAWRHLESRLESYDSEGFEYTFVRVSLV